MQEKIADKGYYVRCNIHFPNNNVREEKVMRAEQYYPAICSLPPLGLSRLSGPLSMWLMCSLALSPQIKFSL